jgi:serine phosphatase RsbU (regulator of sigma subunit)
VASVGAPLIATSGSTSARAFAARARRSPTFAVQGLFGATPQRIAYAVGGRSYVVYGERAIPPDRQVPAEHDSAFADLHFATYLGGTASPRTLSTTNVDPAELPLHGTTAQATIPFGDSRILLVAAPATHLGGTLSARLPWISLGIGLLLTVVAAGTTQQLVRRRLAAEGDATTIKDLYRELDALYGQQRSVSLTLQHALLPRSNPSIEGVEFASAYVAGDQGVEIGGDWYSVIAVPGGRFGFVVGDVSGRGVDAAAIMARARFTLRAYLLEGHDAATTLGMAARDLDIVRDGHLVTVLVGVGDPATRTLSVASAGHPPPLLVTEQGNAFADVAAGPPLGVGVVRYPATTIAMPAGSTLVAFTDGLVERRGEDIDAGFARLSAAASLPEEPLEAWLGALLPTQLGDEATADDVAVLALRWTGDLPGAAASEPAAAEPTLLD